MATRLAALSASVAQTLNWAPGSYSWRLIKRGLTNQVYSLKRGAEHVAFRIDRADAQALGINRQAEITVHRAAWAAGFAPKILLAGSGVFVTRWNTQPRWNAAHLLQAGRLRLLAETLSRLWSLDVDIPTRKLAELFPEDPALHALDALQGVVCHGDLNVNNLLGRDPLMLIDFEFAARCSPAWDLAQLAASQDLAPAQIAPLLGLLRLDLDPLALAPLIAAARRLNAQWLAKVSAA